MKFQAELQTLRIRTVKRGGKILIVVRYHDRQPLGSCIVEGTGSYIWEACMHLFLACPADLKIQKDLVRLVLRLVPFNDVLTITNRIALHGLTVRDLLCDAVRAEYESNG